MLDIKNLKATRDNKQILNGIDLSVKPSEVHAIMGVNGSGKSTLSLALAGLSDVSISPDSSIILDGVDITNMGVSERAQHGIFLAFQNPVEVPGVPYMEFLRLMYNNINAVKHGNSFRKLSPFRFKKFIYDKIKALELSEDFLVRNLNEDFSGGEKKKSEILQLLVLEPKYIILDEIDSGLDVSALKLVANVINDVVKTNKSGVIVITHYNRILEYLRPKYVHILDKGRFVKTGDHSLAKDIEKYGYT